MRIVACLIWFDESPSMLGTSVGGLARVCDDIVAVDGAYALFPGGRARSHPDQAEAILHAAEAGGVGCTIHRPREVFWGNELEKRQLSFELARPFCKDGDWLLVWDADYQMMQAEPDMIRHELEATECVAATYTLLENTDLMDPERGLADFAAKRDIDTEWTTRTRGFYKWTDDLTYGPAHFCIRGTYGGENVWVYGPDLIGGEQDKAVPALDLNHLMVAYHRRSERPLVRNQAADAYYQTRDQVGIESFEGSGLRAPAC